MIYKLNNITFISVGFEGLISVLSGLNQYGVVINTIQSPQQKNIKIIGATPPTINNRIAIESATSADEGNEIIKNQNSCLEQITVIADKYRHFAIDSLIFNLQDSEMKEFVTSDKIVIYNYSKNHVNKKALDELIKLKKLKQKISFQKLLDIFSSKDFLKLNNKNNPKKNKTVFNILYNVNKLVCWVLMPKNNILSPENKYLKIDLKVYLPEKKETPTDYYLQKYNYEELFGE